MRLRDFSSSKCQSIVARVWFSSSGWRGMRDSTFCEVGRRCADGKAREGVSLPMPSASGGALIDVFSYFVYSAS